MMHRRSMTQYTLLALLTASVLLTGCGKEAAMQMPPPIVIIAQPDVRTVDNYIVFTGVTRAIKSAEIKARVSGTLEEINFEASANVEKDEQLFVIEQGYYRALRDEARAAVASAKADLALKESELARIEAAIKTNAVSELDLDRAAAERDMAHANVLSAEAKLEKAELDYSYTTVRAPFAGLVSRNLVDVGNLVGQNEATLLTTVNMMSPIYVYFDAPEHIVLSMLEAENSSVAKNRQNTDRKVPALISTAADKDFPHEGILDYIDNTVNPQTGTIQIRAVLPNEDFLLFPGLFVRVKVMGRPIENSVMIEERAIGNDLGGKYVLVITEDNIVEQRYVTLGDIAEGNEILVEEGLDGSETYVIEGLLKARPGMTVNPLTPEQAKQMAQQQQQGG